MVHYDNQMFNLKDLSLLEQKIKSGNAEVEDYKRLNEFLTNLGLPDFLLDKLKELNVYSFEEYVLRIKGDEKGSSLEVRFRGAALGIISALRTIVK